MAPSVRSAKTKDPSSPACAGLARGVPQRDEDGTLIRWVGLTVDIDDWRRADESREMFVALAEHSSDIVGITDSDGYVVYANPAARAFLSLDDPSAIHFLRHPVRCSYSSLTV